LRLVHNVQNYSDCRQGSNGKFDIVQPHYDIIKVCSSWTLTTQEPMYMLIRLTARRNPWRSWMNLVIMSTYSEKATGGSR
jgi:hypothetical protein